MMFLKGTMRDEGIDITLKSNPGHCLAPDDRDMVIKGKFEKISREEYKSWYLNLLRGRWKTRKKEFLDLARKGLSSDIHLKCYCSSREPNCHAWIAADFMNALANKIKDLQ